MQFTTLYPGWYTGRVNHIHMKMHIGGTLSSAGYDETGSHVAHTGQLFFPQDLNDQVAQLSPYTTKEPVYHQYGVGGGPGGVKSSSTLW